MNYEEIITDHYCNTWNNKPSILKWKLGPVNELPNNFRILEFSPNNNRKMWTYATCGMSQKNDSSKIELHIFSDKQDPKIAELLTSIVHYHRNDNSLNLNHSINFGKPWQDNSPLQYGFISLPYLDGPELEILNLKKDGMVKFYWLIPISKKEALYKKKYGADSLEDLFEKKQLNYLNPQRKELV